MLYPLSYRGGAASRRGAAVRTISVHTHRGPQTTRRPPRRVAAGRPHQPPTARTALRSPASSDPLSPVDGSNDPGRADSIEPTMGHEFTTDPSVPVLRAGVQLPRRSPGPRHPRPPRTRRVVGRCANARTSPRLSRRLTPGASDRTHLVTPRQTARLAPEATSSGIELWPAAVISGRSSVLSGGDPPPSSCRPGLPGRHRRRTPGGPVPPIPAPPADRPRTARSAAPSSPARPVPVPAAVPRKQRSRTARRAQHTWQDPATRSRRSHPAPRPRSASGLLRPPGSWSTGRANADAHRGRHRREHPHPRNDGTQPVGGDSIARLRR